MKETVTRPHKQPRPALRRIRSGARSVWADILKGKPAIWIAKWRLRAAFRGAPVPLEQVLSLRATSQCENILLPAEWTVRSTGRSLHNRFLSSRLADVELGTWRLSAWTLNLLERQIQSLKPQVVLEFGSGVSTVCLARYMQELHGDLNRTFVFSIEQDADFAQETTQLLKALQLDRHARVTCAPLRPQVIEGIQTTCYDLPHSLLQSALEHDRPDLVVIDGPAGESNTRFGDLALVRQFLAPQTRFFMDDALRDEELQVAQLWKRLEYIQVDGVYLNDKGLLAGRIAGCA